MSAPNDDDRFASKCVELRFLSPEQADHLLAEAKETKSSIEQSATRTGLLDVEALDIVQSLLQPTDLAPGYEVLELIGRGGMGVVYRARQIDLDRIVALKVILLGALSNANAAKRFEREALAVARLHHPNIVAAWNFGHHRGRYFLAMEYVQGRTCEDLIRGSKPLSPKLAWHFVRQTASGLSHAHHHQVIHRDIKPSNLIVVPPTEGASLPPGVDMVKIADFGLALLGNVGGEMSKDQARVTTGDALVGSPAFMSPEQFGGDEVDFRSDIYSLGATAVNLLTAAPPFAGKSLAHLASMKMKGLHFDDETMQAITPKQRQLLVEMLASDPNDRPQSYAALVERIDQILQDDIYAESVAAGTHSSGDFQDSRALSHQQSAVTQELPSKEVLVPSKSSRWRVTALVSSWILFSVLAVLYARSYQTRGPRDYTRVVRTEPLFDGLALGGWDVDGSMVGAWTVAPSPPESSSCITCLADQGAITRRLPSWPQQRIKLFVGLNDEISQADIDFGFSADQKKSSRWTLRMTSETISVGRKDDDFSELNLWHQQPAPKGLLDRSHVVDLERQQNDWYVFLEQQFVTSIPIESDENPSVPALRLVVSGNLVEDQSTIFFSDVQASELAKQDK